MPNQHKHAPISIRLPEADRAWLLEHAAATGQPVNAVIRAALAAYRDQMTQTPASARGAFSL